jgi:hypothetical protein
MAWAIASGLKDTENRPWKPARPVRLLIHAGLTFDRRSAAFIAGLGIALPQTFEHRAIIGTAVAAAYTTDSPSSWAEPGMWHWQLTAAVPAITPIPFRGYRRLFTPPPGWQDHFPPLM